MGKRKIIYVNLSTTKIMFSYTDAEGGFSAVYIRGNTNLSRFEYVGETTSLAVMEATVS